MLCVHTELSQHLEDRYQELLLDGTTGPDAQRGAVAELSDDDLLARELRRVSSDIDQDPPVMGANQSRKLSAGL